MKIKSWSDFKSFVDTRALNINWIDYEGHYHMIAYDGPFELKCILAKDDSTDHLDFETNYKASHNKKNDRGPAPFASKYMDGKSLFTRVHGVESSVIVGSNNIDFVVPYANCKFNALEIVNSDVGDKVSLKVLDSDTGMLTTVPHYELNQFGFEINLPDGFYVRESKYDADLIQGLVIRLEYTAAVAKTVKLNVILHELK